MATFIDFISCHTVHNPDLINHANCNMEGQESTSHMPQALTLHAYHPLALVSPAHCGTLVTPFGRFRWKSLSKVTCVLAVCLLFCSFFGDKYLPGEPPPWCNLKMQSLRQSQAGTGCEIWETDWYMVIWFWWHFSDCDLKGGAVIAGRVQSSFAEEIRFTGYQIRELQEIRCALRSHDEYVHCNRSSIFNLVSKIHELES